jgi:adenylate kinase
MPKQEGICDKCGGELYQRADDNEESMNTRVKTYYEVTEPIIDYYKEKGVLKTVDSSKEVEDVFKEIENILGSEDVNN